MRDISLHLLDIIQNSVKAGATSIGVSISADLPNDRLTVLVEDDGCGMDAEFLRRVTDPFTTTRTTRKVGMGIPLLKESCEMTGGDLGIESEKGKGTRLKANFVLSSIDRIPIGNLGETFFGLVLDRPDIDYRIVFQNGEQLFSLDFRDIRKQLENVPLNELSVCEWIRESIEEEKIKIFGGILHEIVS